MIAVTRRSLGGRWTKSSPTYSSLWTSPTHHATHAPKTPCTIAPLPACLTAPFFKTLLDHLNHLGSNIGTIVHHQVSQPTMQVGGDSAVQHRHIRCRSLFTEGLSPFLVIR